jgi:hypothetical protein
MGWQGGSNLAIIQWTLLLPECHAKQFVFLSAFVADREMLLNGFESRGNRLPDEMKFGELPDLHQARIAVDFNWLRSTHDSEHFLEFRT